LTAAQTLIVVVLTAALSSLFTIGLAWLLFDRYGKWWLDRRVAELAKEAEERVRSGAVRAGEELLPGVREQIREGFEDAVASVASGGAADKTVERFAQLSASALGASLGRLFGMEPGKKR
jgi:hypothetical protein